MKTNPIKKALKSGQAQIGTWLSLESVISPRFLARVGYPWLTVDIEHSPINWETAATLFGVIADANCVPLARVPCGNHDYIKRVLDAGAMGIIVPMVNTVQQAKLAIAAAKYPPAGNRSVGGSIHALNFGASAGDYYAQANEEILVILQTESPEGVENAEEIYSLPGVDAIFVGPNDLRFQMRSESGDDPSSEEFEAMLAIILEAGKKANTPVGLHVQTVEEARMRIEQGWQFIAVASDIKMMLNEAIRITKELGISESNDLARY